MRKLTNSKESKKLFSIQEERKAWGKCNKVCEKAGDTGAGEVYQEGKAVYE